MGEIGSNQYQTGVLVGEDVEAAPGVEITRPDGTTLVSSGGVYVIDVPGVHLVGDHTYRAE